MLQVIIPEKEYWDEKTNEFVYTKETVLHLEHSLVSLAKWESKWKKPFISKESKTSDETMDYIKCMTIDDNVDQNIYMSLTKDNYISINSYIEDSMTATTFTKDPMARPNRDIVTAEVLYYYMIAFNIPMECQYWHLNRLLTLIHVCDLKNRPTKKQSMKERMTTNAALNAARRKQYNTTG